MPEETKKTYGTVEEFRKRFFPESAREDREGRGERGPDSFGATLAVNSLHKFATQLHLSR